MGTIFKQSSDSFLYKFKTMLIIKKKETIFDELNIVSDATLFNTKKEEIMRFVSSRIIKIETIRQENNNKIADFDCVKYIIKAYENGFVVDQVQSIETLNLSTKRFVESKPFKKKILVYNYQGEILPIKLENDRLYLEEDIDEMINAAVNKPIEKLSKKKNKIF